MITIIIPSWVCLIFTFLLTVNAIFEIRKIYYEKKLKNFNIMED